MHSVGLILLHCSMAECNLLLVVEPILVIGLRTCIHDPLLEAKITFRQIFRERVSFGCSGMPGEVGNPRNNSTAPMSHNLFSLIRKHFTSEKHRLPIAFGEAGA